MGTMTWFSILIILNLAIAWLGKRLFGVKLFSAWPKYQSEWQNVFVSLAPVIFGSLACLITYLIYLAYS